ncbi:ABC transporter ATP-binding protein [Microbacterium sp.]|uniref:ABC transporter ATP-binding protein n=1 Tax=Microbacterium sp. TaxID=51671 RepID=UPI00263A3243|nr:ABC transporter ATP-binding protein [Microbacterium sp.]
MAEALLSVDGLHKSYGSVAAVAGASLDVYAGEIVCLVGPNGSGKTTLIECIEGLRTPDAGRITLFGDRAGGRRERAALMGVQLQEEGLPARIRVGEAVRLFAAIYGVESPPDELITQLGLDELVRRPFETLSGGQKRRTALALAFINDPRLAILDEPSAGLDPQGQDEIVSIIKERAAGGAGLLVTTHDMQVAADISDRVVVIRSGRTLAAGTPDELLAGIPFEWCLAGPGLERVTEGAVIAQDGRNTRIYGTSEELEHIIDSLPATRRARVTLRRTDLSDVAFHVEDRAVER